jgi:hypothetical protein
MPSFSHITVCEKGRNSLVGVEFMGREIASLKYGEFRTVMGAKHRYGV